MPQLSLAGAVGISLPQIIQLHQTRTRLYGVRWTGEYIGEHTERCHGPWHHDEAGHSLERNSAYNVLHEGLAAHWIRVKEFGNAVGRHVEQRRDIVAVVRHFVLRACCCTD